MTLIDRIRTGVNLEGTTLVEIGPLYRPFFQKSDGDVRYVDHADTDTLRKKYRDGHDFDPALIVDVDAVWGENTLQEALGADTKADYIFASHVIEHVPDLLTWLGELRSVLKPNGEIRLVIPDKRFTFDYIRRETALQDLIEAYARRARRPLPANIFDHVNYVRKVDTGAAWAGALAPGALEPIHSFEMAMELIQDTLQSTNYHDVHCWVFTPYSFARLMADVAAHGLTDLTCHAFEDTLPYTLEFTAYLRASKDRNAVVASWTRMADQVDRNLSPGETHGPAEAALAHELSVLRRDNTELGRQLAWAQAQTVMRQEAFDREIATARATATALRTSTSWRVTAPLRRIASVLRTR
jgi:predicted SAM-dependent methyltransferase